MGMTLAIPPEFGGRHRPPHNLILGEGFWGRRDLVDPTQPAVHHLPAEARPEHPHRLARVPDFAALEMSVLLPDAASTGGPITTSVLYLNSLIWTVSPVTMMCTHTMTQWVTMIWTQTIPV